MHKRSRIPKRRRKTRSRPGKLIATQSQEEHAILRLQRILGNRAVAEIVMDSKARSGHPLVQRESHKAAESETVETVDEETNPNPRTGWASQYGGTRIPPDNLEISAEDLKKIYPQLARDAARKPPKITEEKVAGLASHLSDAFIMMRLDTVEAQASYLGHGAVESDQFRKFTETQSWKQDYEEDPTKIRLDTKWLNKASENPRYKSYKMGGSINPNQDASWQSSFIGRGAVQVTHRSNYKKTLEQMELMAVEHEAGGDTDAAEKIRKAVAEISADPRQAANPRYALLFSAAYMKWSGGEEDVANVGEGASFSGKGAESRWVTGGAREKIDKARLKAGAWRRAREVLMPKAEQETEEDISTDQGPPYGPRPEHTPA